MAKRGVRPDKRSDFAAGGAEGQRRGSRVDTDRSGSSASRKLKQQGRVGGQGAASRLSAISERKSSVAAANARER